MTASIEGTITVPEAARRLNRSIEQVRRYLREGKLKGRRIGNQWFVEERSLTRLVGEPLISKDLLDEMRALREEIHARIGHDIDVVQALRQSRESH